MQASHSCTGQRFRAAALARRHGDHGIRTALNRKAAALASFAEDLVILGQFAFGREYLPLHQARAEP